MVSMVAILAGTACVAAALLVAYGFAGLTGLFVAASAVCGALMLAARLKVPAPERAGRARKQRRYSVEAFPVYRRVESALSWGGTSRRHYDGAPRRFFIRLLCDLLADRRGVDLDRHPDAVRALVGDDLWPLFDPSRPPCRDSDVPGVDAATFARIVDRLEQL